MTPPRVRSLPVWAPYGYFGLFGRAFAIVLVTAANVTFISEQRWAAIFASGFAISAVWWFNSRTAARSDLRGAWLAYALGAGVASVLGAWLAWRI